MPRYAYLLLIAYFVCNAAHAVCPDKPRTLCEMVRDSHWVVHAKVESTLTLSEEGDPQGVAGWLYQLKIRKSYKGDKIGQLSVHSANDTSRIVLDTGKEYIVFVRRGLDQQPSTSNYCDPFSEAGYSVALERQILACTDSKPSGAAKRVENSNARSAR